MELKKAKYAARPIGLCHALALSSSVEPQGFFSIILPQKNKKPLAAAEAPAALLCFYPISAFWTIVEVAIPNRGLFAVPLAWLNGCSGFSWTTSKTVSLLLSRLWVKVLSLVVSRPPPTSPWLSPLSSPREGAPAWGWWRNGNTSQPGLMVGTARTWEVPWGAPMSAHRLVDFGSVTSWNTENICSSGSPEEKKQGFGFRLWLAACLGSQSVQDFWKRLQTCKIPAFPGCELAPWSSAENPPCCSSVLSLLQLKLGVIFAYLTGCSGKINICRAHCVPHIERTTWKPLFLGSYILFLNVVNALHEDRQDSLHLFRKTLSVPQYMCECIFFFT